MSVQEQIRQLDEARKLVLNDMHYCPEVVKGLLPIVQPSAPMLELRRWGADFLAEAFATPALSTKDKETMQVGGVLDTLEAVLNNPKEDLEVLRSIILTCASIYPITLRWTMENAYDTISWQKIQTIKARIFEIWETAPSSIRVCCVKFAQRVVLSQTPTTGIEPWRGDGMDVSLDKIPPGHSLLDPRRMEAEAHGLLDRILFSLQDANMFPLYDNALLVDATVNCLAVLVRSRQNIGTRILNVMLNYDPFRGNEPKTPREKVLLKSISKTVRVFFIGFLKRDPQNPFNQRIHGRLEWLSSRCQSVFDESGRKRPLEPPNMAQSDPKRQRMGQPPAPAPQAQPPPPVRPTVRYETPVLGPGPHSLADMFTLTASTSSSVKDFDVHMLPAHLVSRIVVRALATTEHGVLERKIADVRRRLDEARAQAEQQQAAAGTTTDTSMMDPNTQPLGVDDDDDDDYEPDFYGADEQMVNKMKRGRGRAMAGKSSASLSLEAFKLPTAPPLTQDSALGMGQIALRQVFEDRVTRVGDDSVVTSTTANKGPLGWRQFAVNSGDSDSWVAMIIRIASRSPVEADNTKDDDQDGSTDDNKDSDDDKTKTEEQSTAITKKPSTTNKPVLSTVLREMIFRYIMVDFRKRIDTAVLWLCEEWYNDRIQAKQGQKSNHQAQYNNLVLRLLDGFLPYLHQGDAKVLTRFLSEIPEVNAAVLQRVKRSCRDPTVVGLVLNSLLYMVMMRPPVKEIALDVIQDVWLEIEDARPMAAKYLSRFRGEWLKASQEGMAVKKEGTPVAA